jgi:hypothetical protein
MIQPTSPSEAPNMATESVTIELDADAARVFRDAPPEERRKLAALVSLRLLEAARDPRPLAEVMSEISRNAQARGLTPEILRAILDEP